jgi:hypothetical protein
MKISIFVRRIAEALSTYQFEWQPLYGAKSRIRFEKLNCSIEDVIDGVFKFHILFFEDSSFFSSVYKITFIERLFLWYYLQKLHLQRRRYWSHNLSIKHEYFS